MPTWLDAALAYIPQWLAFQRELLEQPGVSLAIAHNGRVVLESAFGVANQATGEAMTPRHRFRVASHSKTFTTVGILKLVEAGRLRLDDKAGHYVPGLHASVADVSIRELLSNNAGLVRDGRDGGQFNDRRPYLDRDELIADLAVPQPLPAGETMKYSNHGFALAGLIIAAVVKEPYLSWIGREVVAAAGLKETEPDITVGTNTPFASGHTLRVPLGRRLVVPGDNPARAMASAAGYVATTADLARFYSTLVPTAPSSVISAHSRRTMTRRHVRDRHSAIERYYGLGTILGPPGAWGWFGHSGGWQGTLSRTVVVPDHDLCISIATNAADGPAHVWLDGICHILRTFESSGAATSDTAAWTGRWWSLWGASDLVPTAKAVLVANPSLATPFLDASEIAVSSATAGTVATAQAFADLGEPARRLLDAGGIAREIWIGGKRLVREADMARELQERYGARRG